jgi:cytochrome c peroxidase
MKFYTVCYLGGGILFLFFACATLKKAPPRTTPMVALGHAFFFDPRLSANATKACASCHAPQFAFTDGYRKSSGIYADETQRNAPTLLNTRFLAALTWANPLITSYEQQIQKPLFSQDPPEMGVHFMDLEVLQRFQNDTFYATLYQRAFPKKNIQQLDFQQIITPISEYERQLVSFGSRYDNFLEAPKKYPFSALELEGKTLFFSTLHCADCHKLFSEKESQNKTQIVDYQVSEFSSAQDLGLYEANRNTEDKGKFRVPTLRNIALTAPYMHDGSVERLDFALQHHTSALSAKDKKALYAFLQTLTDSTIFSNPLFLKPQ